MTEDQQNYVINTIKEINSEQIIEYGYNKKRDGFQDLF